MHRIFTRNDATYTKVSACDSKAEAFQLFVEWFRVPRTCTLFSWPTVGVAIAAYLKEEQATMTVMLIYMSGFLVVVATVLNVMIMTHR
jgi:hypothetical protein